MDINTGYDTIKIDYEELKEEKQIVTQCNLDAASKGGVKKVCLTNACSIVTKYQVVNRQVKVQGETTIKVVYIDNGNNLQSFDYVQDFIDSINLNDIVLENNINVKASVVDCVSNVIEDEIKTQVVIQLSLFNIKSQEAKILTKISDTIYQATNEQIQIFEKYIKESVEVNTDYKTGVKVDEILYFDTKASVLDVKYENNIVDVLGQLVTQIIYKNENQVTQKVITKTFNKVIETEYDEPLICPYVVVSDSKLAIVGQENDNIFDINITLDIIGALFNIEEKKIIVDLYSPVIELKPTYKSLQYLSKEGIKVAEDKIDGIALVEDDKIVKKIIFALPLEENLINLDFDENGIVKEGLHICEVCYELEDGIIDSIQIELPYLSEINDDGKWKGCDLSSTTLIYDINYKIKRDRAIEVVLSAINSICSCENKKLLSITNVDKGKEIPFSNAGISIFRPDKDDKLWDVAKELGMSMEEIKEQNSQIKDIMDGSERIVVYRELKK